MQRIGELHDEGRHAHRAGEEESIDPRQQPGEEKDRAGQLAPGGDIPEERRDAVGGEVLHESGDASAAHHLRPPVGNEDQRERDAQQQDGDIGAGFFHRQRQMTIRGRLAAADRLIGPIALFVSLYLATFLIVGRAAFRAGWLYPQIVALASVSSATWVTLFFFDRGRVRIGFAVPPLPDFATGALFSGALIALADLLLLQHVRHAWGSGFPWPELGTVFAPAALHEELLFRGYVYQKLRARSRNVAIILTSLVFAVLHAGNNAITALALGNLVLAGILLALAYEARRTLWFPIGLHLAWNVTSGPILGYPVSGYVARQTVLTTFVSGPDWLTGGAFGIEGGVAVTAAECAGIVLLLWWTRMRAAKNRSTP